MAGAVVDPLKLMPFGPPMLASPLPLMNHPVVGDAKL